MENGSRGKLVIVSGPSGVGKSTILRRVFEKASVPLVASVSATTRSPRPGEVDGVDYHFLSPEAFEARRRRGDFIECFQVFGEGTWYGTLREEVNPKLENDQWVVLEIDVKGALAVLREYPDAISIFLRPSSLEVLEQRLRGRGTESEEALKRRLDQARAELAHADHYQHQVINDDLEVAVQKILDILGQNGE